MHIEQQQLKPLSSIALSADEKAIIKWISTVKWEPVKDAYGAISHKAKVPEFFGGVRLYKVQAGAMTGAGAMGALDLFIKKIEYQGIISKQNLYPVITEGAARYLILKPADLANVKSGNSDEDEYGDD